MATPITFPKIQQDAGQRQGPLRVRTLYEALVKSPVAKRSKSLVMQDLALGADGARLPIDKLSALHERLAMCVHNADGEAAIQVLEDVLKDGCVLTGRAIIMAIDAAVANGRLDIGERALLYLPAHDSGGRGREGLQDPVGYEEDKDEAVSVARRSACTVLAVAYSTRGAHEDAARVIGIEDWKAFAGASGDGLERRIRRLQLGKDTVAWGLVVKTLTKMGAPHAAVSVVDLAMRDGVSMTDALLHLTIDALRRVGKWREAAWLFDRAVEKGIKPHERTLATMLLALTSRLARNKVDVEQVHRVLDMADNPSLKFMSVALMALSSVGSLERAERMFSDIQLLRGNEAPDEMAFSCMMAAYPNYLDRFADDNSDSDDSRRERTLEEVNCKADQLWAQYMRNYRLARPYGMKRPEREGMLSKYLRTKTRCLRNEQAVTLLEDVARRRDFYPWLEVRIFHVTAVLGAVELCCDVGLLHRLLSMMETCGLAHDMRSLGFAIGTYVGDGNLSAALDLVREHGPKVLARETLERSYRDYYPALLLRRVQLLADGFRDIGVGSVADIEAIISDLHNERVNIKLAAGRSAKRQSAFDADLHS